MSDLSPRLPGLPGDPNLTLADDPRTDPRLVEVMMTAWGYGDLGELAVAGGPGSSDEELVEYLAGFEAGVDPMYAKVFGSLPPVPGVARRAEVISGVDGNGTIHGADTEVMVGAMPDVYGATIRDIHGFARFRDPERRPQDGEEQR